ncbi:cyclin-O [Tachysurus fulvidraco]|uniref:cyclin-O n=1 Tax=Tachysurus fulvidraco TaxID=1234273 RepID=UPI001FF07B94|nr:cyclin-O [Tachysurus fulvidraco]
MPLPEVSCHGDAGTRRQCALRYPGKSHISRHAVQQSNGLGLGQSQRFECATVQRGEASRTAVRVNMFTLSDSGFEEDLHSPSPSPRHSTWHWSGSICYRLTADCLHNDYDESCFRIQRNNEEDFLALDCLAHQPQITAEARCKLVSWLLSVYKHFKLSFESCCLAVNIMDRFLVTTSVAADCFQLLGVTSLLIATKHVEVFSPRIKQLLSLCCDAFSREQLCNLECLILLRLNFRLAAPTLAFFLDYFISRELSRHTTGAEENILNEGNKQRSWKATEEKLFSVKRYKCLAGKVCELSLADYAFNKYQPSVIVQSALNLAKDLLKRQPSVKHIICSEMLDFLCAEDDKSQGSDHRALIQQCTQELQLLVSLNQESIQDLITL